MGTSRLTRCPITAGSLVILIYQFWGLSPGTVVLAGPTPDTIHVMIPDCLVPPVGTDVRIDLRHVVTLQLGLATDIGDNFPPPGLARALCSKPLAPTIMLQPMDYWDEINPLLAEWKNVNDFRCPECDRSIRVNMARHLRLCHTTYICVWRCPVSTCLEWYGSRSFFDQHKEATQSIWMDLALAHRSGQELHNTYSITQSLEFAPLRLFFIAAVNQLQLVFDDYRCHQDNRRLLLLPPYWSQCEWPLTSVIRLPRTAR